MRRCPASCCGWDEAAPAPPRSPLWVRLLPGRGSYRAGRATVGAAYDFRSSGAEAGATVPLGEGLTGSVALRVLQGSADVASPAGRGRIEAEGLGIALGAFWESGDWYGAARLSLTDWEAEASPDVRGAPAAKVGARGRSAEVEAGRRFAVGGRTALTPRARIGLSGLALDPFADAADARVSLADGGDRVAGGAGLLAETEAGALSLHASLDLARTFGGAGTTVAVSGETLRSAAEKDSVLLGLGGSWERGGLSLRWELSARGPGSDDERYRGILTFGAQW